MHESSAKFSLIFQVFSYIQQVKVKASLTGGSTNLSTDEIIHNMMEMPALQNLVRSLR